jgi:hypothetical protein
MVSGVGALGIGWRNLENSRGFICGGSLGVRLFFFFFFWFLFPVSRAVCAFGMLVFLSRAVCAFGM